ncbi:MAG: hypothetical protein COA96_03525 [SAR86 cluster bacterium]|uniref:DUF2214 domain-containing protein n=1 Tax=SAR86 cluster bacterium TaxID=2030880 RepID=A0A2A5B8D4_9GAMM|nr:MAG: hypothetical protein COA96_03525 [SAR86 cluster bacterium]
MLESYALLVVDSPLNLWIQSTYWLWPVLEIIHFIGLSLLLGGLIVIDLRMAGHFSALNPAATHKLLPLVLLGFGLNFTTGLLFFHGDPLRYSINIGFQIKMILIILAGLNALLYYWKVRPVMHTWNSNSTSPITAKLVAYTSLILWTGVLLCGRLIPYVGTG